MKRLFFIFSIISVAFITSCSVSREAGLTGDRQTDEATIRQAVESRRFIIKLDRLYTFGGTLFLRPRSNYIIVDGQKAIINTAYIGRQYDIRPIAGINLQGRATEYKITNKQSRGTYQISMKVGNQSNSFNIYLTIGKTGDVNATVDNIRIENTRYSGYIVPIGEPQKSESTDELI